MKSILGYIGCLCQWWWLLLLSAAIGGLAGFADYQRQDHPSRYQALATIAVQEPNKSHPTFLVKIETEGERTAKDAVTSAGLMISQMGAYGGSLVTIQDLTIDKKVDDGGWWKATLMGSTIVMLLAVAGIYVWGDVLSIQRRLPMDGTLEAFTATQPVGETPEYSV
jgi:hypothetical protein